MCLGIPMRVLKIKGKRAIVSAGRIDREISIELLVDPNVGDYVLVHAGFAIERLNPKEAEETLRMIGKIT